MTSADILPPNDSVLHQENESVPVHEVVQGGQCRKPITKEKIESIAIKKYRTNGRGITIVDIMREFSIKKGNAQRSLKCFCSQDVLFTAHNLISQRINLLQNKNPQEYFPTCIKSDIIKNLERKNVLVEPTGVGLLNNALSSSSYRLGYPLSNALQLQKAKSFLDVLLLLPFNPPHLHRMLVLQESYQQER